MSLKKHAVPRRRRWSLKGIATLSALAVVALSLPMATSAYAAEGDVADPAVVSDVVLPQDDSSAPADNPVAPEVAPTTEETDITPIPDPVPATEPDPVLASEPAPEPDPAPALEQATEPDITAPLVRTMTTPPVVDPTPYVLVAWKMPAYTNATTAHWPQTSPHAIDLSTKDLSALDSWVAGQPYGCYQIDGYNDNAITTSLIAGGHLDGLGNPPESLWAGGWGVAYKVVQVGDGCTPPPPVDVCPSDFKDYQMWEVTWGYGFADRNGGAPLFTMASNGGLVGINDGPVPAYMTSGWHWLYVNKPAVDRIVTYQFADGTERQATITGDANGCPSIVWTETPPVVEPYMALGDFVCAAEGGEQRFTWNNEDSTVNVPMKALVDGVEVLSWTAAAGDTGETVPVSLGSDGYYDVELWAFIDGEWVLLDSGTVEVNCVPDVVQCEQVVDGGTVTNLDMNSWTVTNGTWTEDGLRLNSDNWVDARVTKTTSFNLSAARSLALDMDVLNTAGNYGLGIELQTSAGILHWEDVYTNEFWSYDEVLPPQLGGQGGPYSGSLEDALATIGDVEVTSVTIIFSSATPNSAILNSETSNCSTVAFEYERPPAPPTKDPTFTEWSDGDWVCGDTTVQQTQTRTDYAAPVWDPETMSWIEDKVGTPTILIQPRDLKPEEIKEWQTADPEGECYNRPDAPNPEKGSRTVVTCTSATDYTWDINPVWNESTGKYDMVKGPETASSPQTPTATELKDLTCTSPPPPPTCPSGTTWTDSNHDGKVTSNECTTPPSLASTGFNAANLGFVGGLSVFAGWVLLLLRRRMTAQ